MAFLFATTFYLFSILFYSISHCLSVGRTEGSPVDWSYGSHGGFGGFKAAFPTVGEVCNRFNFIRSQKLICLICRGLSPSCFVPPTTSPPTTTPKSTTTALTTTTQTSRTPTTTTSTTTVAPAGE